MRSSELSWERGMLEKVLAEEGRTAAGWAIAPDVAGGGGGGGGRVVEAGAGIEGVVEEV